MKKITILLLSLMCLKMSAQITTRSPEFAIWES